MQAFCCLPSVDNPCFCSSLCLLCSLVGMSSVSFLHASILLLEKAVGVHFLHDKFLLFFSRQHCSPAMLILSLFAVLLLWTFFLVLFLRSCQLLLKREGLLLLSSWYRAGTHLLFSPLALCISCRFSVFSEPAVEFGRRWTSATHLFIMRLADI